MLIDPRDHKSELEQSRGTEAKIWIFHVTLNRLAIGLFRKCDPEALYIVAIGCEHLSGPFSWEEANLSIIEGQNDHGEVRHRVIDHRAGFELLCADVAMSRGLAAVPNNPFDGFLRDA